MKVNMMKSFLFGLLSLISANSIGNSIGVFTSNIGNVYYNGILGGEIEFQNQSVAFLCNEYMKTYYPWIGEMVFLELEVDNNSGCYLSYDKFEGDEWNSAEQNRPVKGFGIRIRLSLNSKRAESVLKLLDYALNNVKELESQSNNYYALDEDLRPEELTVSSVVMSDILKKQVDDKIKNTLAIKVFRSNSKIHHEVYTRYFFQNDKYYFVDSYRGDSVYLELSNVYQIINEYYLGTLIFDTDSTGYFYNVESKSLSSKFKIDDKKAAFYFTHTSSDTDKKRIYFEYDSYTEGKKKFIYLANRFMLIQKVEVLEDEIINRVIEGTYHNN